MRIYTWKYKTRVNGHVDLTLNKSDLEVPRSTRGLVFEMVKGG